MPAASPPRSMAPRTDAPLSAQEEQDKWLLGASHTTPQPTSHHFFWVFKIPAGRLNTERPRGGAGEGAVGKTRREPAQAKGPLRCRARFTPAAATSCSLRRRRYALIHVHVLQ